MLYLKYLLERWIRWLLNVFRVFPIRQNQILFSSFSGRQYSDSPRRISECLRQEMPQLQQVWAFTEPERYRWLEASGVRIVKYKSLAYLFRVMTSKVYVDNVEYWSILGFRPGQMVLETWHGGGAYKAVGADRIDIGGPARRHVLNKMSRVTHFVSSSRAFTRFVIEGAYQYHGTVLPAGLPRNDELLSPDPVRCERIRKAVGLDSGAKVVLYAPTFRKSLRTDLYDLDIPRLRRALSQRFGGEWTVLLRLHYYMSDGSTVLSGQCLNVSGYPDMQELLQIADVLITDYSSSMWDFSLMERPCFLYVRDLDTYRHERDFYTPMETWPFPAAKDNQALERLILEFQPHQYKAAVRAHHEALGSYEAGHATRTVCREIKAFIVGGHV